MTEQQLRDVLARVVPEPPDSVADPAPVVRVARRRRQVRVACVAALAAVLVAGTVVGVRALDTDQKTVVIEQPRIPDPYTTAPCPDPAKQWDVAPLEDLTQVTAARFCARDVKGADGADGPRDALVVDVSSFTEAVGALAPADPARCAGIDPPPTDDRILFELADGSSIGVSAWPCRDVDVEGRTLDGLDVTMAFLGALREQRDDHEYAQAEVEPATCVFGSSDISPAQPGHERLVSGTACNEDPSGPLELTTAQLSTLQKAWASAKEVDNDDLDVNCSSEGDSQVQLFVRTDRGDNIQIDASCKNLVFDAWNRTSYRLDLTADQLFG